ncbi:MAG: MFS transporter [Flavobacteriales bacterium]|nr:MFS transporter [Flavobacteriales bacterium]
MRWFPISSYRKAFGVFCLIIYSGGAVVGPITVFLISEFGWQASFYISSPIYLALAALWWWYSRDRPEENQSINNPEVELINDASIIEETNTENMHWGKVFVQKPILLITLSYFCQAYVTFFFYNWLFIYLTEEKGFSNLDGGFASALPWIVAGIAALLAGPFCDWMASKFSPDKTLKYICIGALFLVAGSMYWGAMVDDKYTALLLL